MAVENVAVALITEDREAGVHPFAKACTVFSPYRSKSVPVKAARANADRKDAIRSECPVAALSTPPTNVVEPVRCGAPADRCRPLVAEDDQPRRR